MPQYLYAAVDYGRAQKAIDAHKYLTAQKNLASVLKKFPDEKIAKADMLIAACYNRDFAVAGQMFDQLEHETFENDILEKTNEAVAFLTALVPVDTGFLGRLNNAAKDSVAGLQKLFNETDTSGAKDQALQEYLIADRMFDFGAYEESKKITTTILSKSPDNFGALQLRASLNRNLKNYDEAIADCDKMLTINKEDVLAISQKAKIELKRKNDKAATAYADQAYRLDNKNLGALEAKALVDYYTGKKDEGTKILADIKSGEPDTAQVIYSRTLKVYNGTDSYR